MAVETDWLGEPQASKPDRSRGGRKRTNGAGDRSRLIECPECGFKARTSATALREAGFPTCGCGTRLELANMRDRAAVEPDALLDDLAKLAPRDQNAAYRELGWHDLTVPLDSKGRIAAGPRSGVSMKRCAWEGGYCTKFATGRYCPEHGNGSDRTYRERGI